MKKILSGTYVLLCLVVISACAKAPSAGNTTAPRYTEDEVLEIAKTRSDVGLDSHIEWTWYLEYLPARPELKQKAVWNVTQTGIDMSGMNSTQTIFFHEDTGKFTYKR